jgi:hypothetical protein
MKKRLRRLLLLLTYWHWRDVAAGLGIMLSVSSGKPTVTGASQK